MPKKATDYRELGKIFIKYCEEGGNPFHLKEKKEQELLKRSAEEVRMEETSHV